MVENKLSLIERLRARHQGRKVEGEKGLALLDVLIGIAIFALIAIIAVSAIGQYRAKAYESSAVSDAQAVGIAIEAAITDANGAAMTAVQTANKVAIAAGGTTLDTVVASHDGKNVVTMSTAPTAANAYTFVVCVVHDGAEFAKYDSEEGGITEKGRTGGACS